MTPTEAEKILAEPKKRREWKITAALVLSFLVVGMLAVVTPLVISTSNTTGALADSTDLASCRSEANAALTDATSAVNRLRTNGDALQLQFNDALTRGDAPALARLTPLFDPLRIDLLAAQKVADDRNDEYQAAVRLAVDDPDRFLALCRSHKPYLTPGPSSTSSTTTAAPTSTSGPVVTSTTTVATIRRRPTTTTRPGTTTSTTRPTTSTTYYTPPQTTPSGSLLCDLLPMGVPCLV